MRIITNWIGKNVLHLAAFATTPKDEEFLPKFEASLPCVPKEGIDAMCEGAWHRLSLLPGDLVPEQDANRFDFYFKPAKQHPPIPA
jgi:hypothetical protein